ncbi:hypothetical protein [Entomohabitans teleogrylli]|uniref:hypothetical protein n=1 Tax=Entomohabitans teleogrylli TaxID=1384589 RepID=UPI00073D9CE9|nr:hypothetical protein [Entomohabitans teleogrylli]
MTLITGLDGKAHIVHQGTLQYLLQDNNSVSAQWRDFSGDFLGEKNPFFIMNKKSSPDHLYSATQQILQTPFHIDLSTQKSDFSSNLAQRITADELLARELDKETPEGAEGYEAVIPAVNHIYTLLASGDGMLVNFRFPQNTGDTQKYTALFNTTDVTVKVEKKDADKTFYSLKTNNDTTTPLWGTLTFDSQTRQLQNAILISQISPTEKNQFIDGKFIFHITREGQQHEQGKAAEYVYNILKKDIPEDDFFAVPRSQPSVNPDAASFPWNGLITAQKGNLINLYTPLSASQFRYYASAQPGPDNMSLSAITVRDIEGKALPGPFSIDIIGYALEQNVTAGNSYGIQLAARVTPEENRPLPPLYSLEADITWLQPLPVIPTRITLDPRNPLKARSGARDITFVPHADDNQWEVFSGMPGSQGIQPLNFIADGEGVTRSLSWNTPFSFFSPGGEFDLKDKIILSGLSTPLGEYFRLRASAPPTLALLDSPTESKKSRYFWHTPQVFNQRADVSLPPLQFNPYALAPRKNIDTATLEQYLSLAEEKHQSGPQQDRKRISIDSTISHTCELSVDAQDLRWKQTGFGATSTFELSGFATAERRTVRATATCLPGIWRPIALPVASVWVSIATLQAFTPLTAQSNAWAFFNHTRFIDQQGTQLAPLPAPLLTDDTPGEPGVILRPFVPLLMKSTISQFTSPQGKLRFSAPVTHIERFEKSDAQPVIYRWDIPLATEE